MRMYVCHVKKEKKKGVCNNDNFQVQIVSTVARAAQTQIYPTSKDEPLNEPIN